MFIDDGDDKGQRRRFSRRALLLGVGQAAAFGAVAGRLYQLQVLDEAKYALLADENRLNVQLLAPARGRILDRYGEVLAYNTEGFRVVVVPSLAGDVAAVLRRLARVVPIAADEQERIVQRAKKQSPNLPVIVARDLTFELVAEINLLAPQLPGVRTETAGRRLYAHGRTMGHIVGHVGSIERLALDDEPVLRLPDMKFGKVGIERGQEEALRGSGGTVKHEVDARGRIIRNLEQTEPVAGRDVGVTIDTALQAKVLARLAPFRRAAAVAMDAATGEVVAMASVPGFDPNDMVGRATRRGVDRLTTARDDPMINRAIRGQYPPGSTFKMVTALAGLEAGLINTATRVTCDGRFELAGQGFRCWNRGGHGSVDLHRALRESCDVYFYELANRLGIAHLASMARRLGFGHAHDCGIAHVKPGLVPDPDWKRARFNRPWLGGETVLAGIGQGYVLATPLQLAVMTARLATGRAVVPTLVRRPKELQLLAPAMALRPEWLAAIRRGMIAVVNEDGGTGYRAKPSGEGYTLAGKTGTSQVGRASQSETSQSEIEWLQRDHALFVAYVPADRPRYAVAAIVEHGGGGGATAAPLVRDIVEDVMARDPSGRPAWPDFAEQPAAPPIKGRG